MVCKLALVPIADENRDAPAAMHEKAAARYVGMNRYWFVTRLMEDRTIEDRFSALESHIRRLEWRIRELEMKARQGL